jgi:hypothetical protein
MFLGYATSQFQVVTTQGLLQYIANAQKFNLNIIIHAMGGAFAA